MCCGGIASAQGWDVSFLDDNAPGVLGCLGDYEDQLKNFDYAFVALGNPELRENGLIY